MVSTTSPAAPHRTLTAEKEPQPGPAVFHNVQQFDPVPYNGDKMVYSNLVETTVISALSQVKQGGPCGTSVGSHGVAVDESSSQPRATYCRTDGSLCSLLTVCLARYHLYAEHFLTHHLPRYGG